MSSKYQLRLKNRQTVRTLIVWTLLWVILLCSVGSLSAQDRKVIEVPQDHSIEGVLDSMLEIISGKKGKVRDWDYFRELFLPTARFTILNHPSDSMNFNYEMVTLDEFIEMMHDAYYDEGFTEYELGKVVNEYNGIANVFQSFYAIDSEGEEGKGITSYQLVKFDDRWWISDVLWTTDSNGVEIPDEYIKD